MTRFRFLLLSVILASLVLMSACDKMQSSSGDSDLTAQLSGSSEVPPVVSDGRGTIDANLNAANNKLDFTVTYSNLSGAPTAAHFHGPATAGENADVAVPITGDLASPIAGSVSVTAPQAAELRAGKWYVNLHTAAHPDGEIRGQIMLKP